MTGSLYRGERLPGVAAGSDPATIFMTGGIISRFNQARWQDKLTMQRWLEQQ
jgi:hypothetical protein